MKKILYMIATFIIVVHNVQASLVVEQIQSEDLSQEREVFIRFVDRFCGVCLQQSIASQVIEDAFTYEEQLYQEKNFKSLFFHAKLDDFVVGYISCDVLPGYKVRIRQMAIDPEMYDEALVKDLLYAIFEEVPKTKYVTVSCPVGCLELIHLFEELGFVRSTKQPRQAISLYVPYELQVSSKCKICDVLYGNIWDDVEEDGLEEVEEGFDPLADENDTVQ